MTLTRTQMREAIRHGDRIEGDVEDKADVVVIGSGPGGLATADLLSAAGFDVVVCEEGGYFDESDFTQSFPEMSKKLYRDAGATGTVGHPPIIVPVGKAVGGTALINSGTCFRTPNAVLQTWRLAHGVEAASPAEMAPIFDEVERRNHVHTLQREVWGKNALVVERGARELGLNFQPLRHNAAGCNGCGTCTYGCVEGAKRPPNLVYLPTFLARGGRFYSRARVKLLTVSRGRVRGVEARFCDDNGTERDARLRIRAKLVVLAAGAFQSPAMLLYNRIGLSSGQVGRNLSIHPACRVTALFDEEIRGWEGVPQGTYIDDFAKDGIIFEGIFVPPSVGAGAFWQTGTRLQEMLSRYDRISMYGAMISDTSAGRVILHRGRPLTIYQMNKRDAATMLRAVGILCKIYEAAGAKRLFPKIGELGEIAPKDADLLFRRKPSVGDFELTAFHPLGTCRMGADPRTSVVNPWGKLHDLDGLFVCDGSIMPSPLGVNPQITILAFAHRTAAHIASDAHRYL